MHWIVDRPVALAIAIGVLTVTLIALAFLIAPELTILVYVLLILASPLYAGWTTPQQRAVTAGLALGLFAPLLFAYLARIVTPV
jgi:hypothetical protein